MSKLKYVGVLTPSVAADRFVSSIFVDEAGNYFIQVEKDDVIAEFKPVLISRELMTCVNPLEAEKNDQAIYSFITSSKELLYGTREIIEPLLVALIDSEYLNVHSRLLISNFLKLFSKTLDLIDASNKDLEEKGVKEMISRSLPFANNKKQVNDHADLMNAIINRFQKFNRINQSIRIEDIAFINQNKAYFIHYELHIATIINKKILKNQYNGMILSKLVIACIEKDTINIKTMINESSESYEFLLLSEFVVLKQHQIESLASDIANKYQTDPNQSILEIGIHVDKKIHGNDVVVNSPETSSPFDIETLNKSFLSIIAKI